MTDPDPWPLRHLELHTPRLSLRPDDDDGLRELAALATRGIHPAEQMPFSVPWTDQEPVDLARGVMQHHWTARGAVTPQRWSLHFLVRRDGAVVGTQTLSATEFPVIREVSSGSWVGRAHQGDGIGTEMRAAVLAFAFDHLGALAARSSAFGDNIASRKISRKLGYRGDGTDTVTPRGTRVTEYRLLLRQANFQRPQWTLEVDGLDACRSMLGAG